MAYGLHQADELRLIRSELGVARRDRAIRQLKNATGPVP